MITVLVADDHPVVRAGLRALLAGGDIDVVAEAADWASALEATRRLRPRVVVMDFALPGIVPGFARELGGARVLLLTTFETNDDIARALGAGADACIAKDASRAALVAAVRG